jgi:predicted MFS family arabinose efflux permease
MNGKKWVVLSAYLGALVLTQVFWYNFAPLLSLIVSRYGVSELTAGWTILVFPLASLLISGHAGSLIDRRGYRFSIQAGLVVMSVSAVLRIFDSSFWMILAGQAGIAVSVPYIVTGISKLVSDWFDPHQEALITGYCTIGIFVGMSISLAASPQLVNGFGFRGSMIVLALAAIVWTVVFKLAVSERQSQAAADAGAKTDFRALLTNRNLLVIFATAFIGQGCFNALTTWMEVIWHERGFASEAAGLASGIVIIGGIVGSFLVPPLADRFPHPRAILWACVIPCLFLIHPFLLASSPRMGYTWGAGLGLFWLPTLAISLTLLERSAHKEHAGAAAGIFWTAGNAGVLGLTILFEQLKEATNWGVAIQGVIFLMAVMVALIGLLRFRPESEH